MIGRQIDPSNYIPGCESYTKASEIGSLQKYLKKGISDRDSELKVDDRILAAPGTLDPRVPEITNLPDGVIGLSASDTIRLEDRLVTLSSEGDPGVALEEHTETLPQGEPIEGLPEEVLKLSEGKKISGLEKTVVKTDGRPKDVKLSKTKVGLESEPGRVELEDTKETLQDTKSVKSLETKTESLDISSPITSLEGHKEGLNTTDDALELPMEVEEKLFQKTITNLENRIDPLTRDSGEVDLENRVIELGDHSEDLSLEDKKINLESGQTPELPKTVLTLEDQEVTLEDQVINLKDPGQVSLETTRIGLGDANKAPDLPKETVELRSNTEVSLMDVVDPLKGTNTVSDLRQDRETIEDNTDVSLPGYTDTISWDKAVELVNTVDKLTDPAKVSELPDELITVVPKEIGGLEDHKEKLGVDPSPELSKEVITLNGPGEVQLEKTRVSLEDPRGVKLETEVVPISDKRVNQLSRYREGLSVTEDIQLSDDVSPLTGATELDLLISESIGGLKIILPENQVREDDTELEDSVLGQIYEVPVDLEDEVLKISDPRTDKLENRRYDIIYHRENTLEDYVEGLSDDRENRLEDYVDGLSDTRDNELEDYVDKLSDERDNELEDYVDRLSDGRDNELEDYVDGLSDGRDNELEDYVDKLSDERDNELEDYVDDLSVDINSFLEDYVDGLPEDSGDHEFVDSDILPGTGTTRDDGKGLKKYGDDTKVPLSIVHDPHPETTEDPNWKHKIDDITDESSAEAYWKDDYLSRAVSNKNKNYIYSDILPGTGTTKDDGKGLKKYGEDTKVPLSAAQDPHPEITEDSGWKHKIDDITDESSAEAYWKDNHLSRAVSNKNKNYIYSDILPGTGRPKDRGQSLIKYRYATKEPLKINQDPHPKITENPNWKHKIDDITDKSSAEAYWRDDYLLKIDQDPHPEITDDPGWRHKIDDITDGESGKAYQENDYLSKALPNSNADYLDTDIDREGFSGDAELSRYGETVISDTLNRDTSFKRATGLPNYKPSPGSNQRYLNTDTRPDEELDNLYKYKEQKDYSKGGSPTEIVDAYLTEITPRLTDGDKSHLNSLGIPMTDNENYLNTDTRPDEELDNLYKYKEQKDYSKGGSPTDIVDSYRGKVTEKLTVRDKSDDHALGIPENGKGFLNTTEGESPKAAFDNYVRNNLTPRLTDGDKSHLSALGVPVTDNENYLNTDTRPDEELDNLYKYKEQKDYSKGGSPTEIVDKYLGKYLKDMKNQDPSKERSAGLPKYTATENPENLKPQKYFNTKKDSVDSYIDGVESGLKDTKALGIPAYKLGGDFTSYLNPSKYLRWTVENTVGKIPLRGTLKSALLTETLTALIQARDLLESAAGIQLYRLPGSTEHLLKALRWSISGIGTSDAISMGKNIASNLLFGATVNIDQPINRPTEVKDVGYLFETRDGRSNYDYIDPKKEVETKAKDKLKAIADAALGGNKGLLYYSPVFTYMNPELGKDDENNSAHTCLGLYGTLSNLGKVNENITSFESLKQQLEESPYHTNSIRLTGARAGDTHRHDTVMTLDSNHVWEIIFEPYLGSNNGNRSFLPSIQQINYENYNNFGYNTNWNTWIPFTGFELSSKKIMQKSIGLYAGELSIPQNLEFTNELRLSICDDQYKSWKRYFEYVLYASMYHSNANSNDYYVKKFLPKNCTFEKKDVIHFNKGIVRPAPYKNLTFRCKILSMNTMLQTLNISDLLVVLKDFQEEWQGEVDASPTELSLMFSVVGENPRTSEEEEKEVLDRKNAMFGENLGISQDISNYGVISTT